MNLNRINCIALALTGGLVFSLPATAQTTTLFTDDFNRVSLTTGAPTTYLTSVTAGDGGASLVSSQFLRLTNDATAAANKWALLLRRCRRRTIVQCHHR